MVFTEHILNDIYWYDVTKIFEKFLIQSLMYRWWPDESLPKSLINFKNNLLEKMISCILKALFKNTCRYGLCVEIYPIFGYQNNQRVWNTVNYYENESLSVVHIIKLMGESNITPLGTEKSKSFWMTPFSSFSSSLFCVLLQKSWFSLVILIKIRS